MTLPGFFLTGPRGRSGQHACSGVPVSPHPLSPSAQGPRRLLLQVVSGLGAAGSRLGLAGHWRLGGGKPECFCPWFWKHLWRRLQLPPGASSPSPSFGPSLQLRPPPGCDEATRDLFLQPRGWRGLWAALPSCLRLFLGRYLFRREASLCGTTSVFPIEP